MPEPDRYDGYPEDESENENEYVLVTVFHPEVSTSPRGIQLPFGLVSLVVKLNQCFVFLSPSFQKPVAQTLVVIGKLGRRDFLDVVVDRRRTLAFENQVDL